MSIKQDNLYTGAEAQKKLQVGIEKVANAVGITMGTGGSNAILEAIENPGHIMTNDGYSIANAIKLSDPIEEMGKKILLESINRANKASGDGSSTTCVLTKSIIEAGQEAKEKHSPMDIKRSIDDYVSLIEKELESQSKVIEPKEVGKVATISAEDEEIGNRIQEIYEKIGKSGLIYWDISKTTEDSYTIGTGITVEGAKLVSPYMADIAESGQSMSQASVKNANILITKQKLSNAAEFNAIAESLHNDDIHDLVVFCDDFDPLILPALVQTRIKQSFRFVLIKMPVLWRDWWYEDIAKATGATVIDPANGLRLKDAKREHLGVVDQLIASQEDTYLDGIKDVSNYVKSLEELDDDDSKLRASRLNTKTARYFVGAQSDSALSYRRLKVEDAISAAYQALNGGIVAGGGVALRNVANSLPSDSIGGQILKKSLVSIEKQIASNSGYEIYTGNEQNCGLNSKTGEYVDMLEKGIVDPKNVVLNACKNAISVASTVLTAPTIVSLPREEHDTNPLVNPQGPVL